MYGQLLANSLVPLLGNNVFEDTLVHDSCLVLLAGMF